MNLEINSDVLKGFDELGIQRDYLGSCMFVLTCFREERYDLLDEFDDFNKERQALNIYKELERVGLLKREKSVKHSLNFSITDNGLQFVGAIKPEVKPIVKTTTEDWIGLYRKLWIDPNTGKFYTAPDKRSLGASEKDLTLQMRKFVSSYRDIFKNLPGDLTMEYVIIEATRKYIEEYKKVKFSFCKDAFYFISKTEHGTTRSLLATNCESFIQSYGKEGSSNSNAGSGFGWTL